VARSRTGLVGWALEGLPFAGKSSTAHFLKALWPETLLVPDYHDLLPTDRRQAFAQMSVSASEQRSRIERYLELDRMRWQTVLDANTSQVVLDRCHLSLMAYAIALEPAIGTSASSESLAHIEHNLRDPAHPLGQPAGIVYLEMNAETASKRCSTYATTMHWSLRTVEFARRLIEAYELVLSNVPIEVVRCSSEQSLDALHADVSSALRPRLV